MYVLFYVAIILAAGMIMARLVSLLKLPNVTGYLMAGLIIGPSLFNLIPGNIASSLSVISEAALGFIAYSIGSEFSFTHLKKVGKRVLLITVFEALGAVAVVDFMMFYVFKMPLPFCIIVGAIAAATAPAATIMVVRQYNAKGPVTDALLPIVAMDDAVGIMAFGISVAVAKVLIGNGSASLVQAVLAPVLEIAYAIGIGFLLGLLLSFISKKASGENELLAIVITLIFAGIGIAKAVDASPLLTCMMIGATAANLAPNSSRVLSVVERFTPPVFIAFFTVAGVDLNINVLREVGLIGLGYIAFRVLGKMLGVAAGAAISNSPKTVRKYLGFTLVPQAGVAIGLAMVAEAIMPQYGMQIRTIILSATVVYELVGPVLTKIALTKAGEIQYANDSGGMGYRVVKKGYLNR